MDKPWTGIEEELAQLGFYPDPEFKRKRDLAQIEKLRDMLLESIPRRQPVKPTDEPIEVQIARMVDELVKDSMFIKGEVLPPHPRGFQGVGKQVEEVNKVEPKKWSIKMS